MSQDQVYTKDILPGGLRVITAPMPSTRSVTVMLMAAVGSRYETRQISGIAHFMEHMFFKGAEKYPDAMAVASAIDGVGGVFNAFTSEEKVAYYVKLTSGKTETAYDVLSDMLHRSKFDPVEIDKERGVIVEELRMYNDDPMSRIQMAFKSHFFGDQPLGWDVGGTEQVVNSVTREDFIHFRDLHYTARNCVLSVAGDITRARALELAQSYFSFDGHDKITPPPYVPQPGARSVLIKKDTEQGHFILGFPIPGEEEAIQPTLKILSVIMGGSMSSRLFHEIREKRGLAYYISSGRRVFTDTGAFMIAAGVNVDKLGDAVACVMEELAKAADKGFTAEELTRGRENIKGKLDLSMEDSMTQANLYASREAIYGKIKTAEQMVEELDSVTLDQLNAAASICFDATKVKMAALGPYKDLEQFDKKLEG
ncbi:MAG: insulinase family protein [Nitrospinota bacterium]|nr:insulinase family protein [Nitrospinota bacterium]MDH5755300.1 insulinase family protein [Nitrospinota bacterium]